MKKRISQPDSKEHGGHSILFAVLGMSPAVLTETIWALARRDASTMPHAIFVVTTSSGYSKLRELLFENGAWERFVWTLKRRGLPVGNRLRFGLAHDHVRLLPKPDGKEDLQDITTCAESEAAADCIMRCLREFATDPETRIIASIAGGRKTMSALLTSCMTLLGRKQDMLCHVLVSPPYDNPKLTPPFLYPQSNVKHRLPGDIKSWPSRNARIDLVQIPFVRIRTWYERDFLAQPTSYMELVRCVQKSAEPVTDYPIISINMMQGTARIGEENVDLSAGEFALFYILASRICGNRPPARWDELDPDFAELNSREKRYQYAPWHVTFRAINWNVKEDTRKKASTLRHKLRRVLQDRRLVDALVPTPSSRLDVTSLYPVKRIKINE